MPLFFNTKKTLEQLICDWGHSLPLFRSHFACCPFRFFVFFFSLIVFNMNLTKKHFQSEQTTALHETNFQTTKTKCAIKFKRTVFVLAISLLWLSVCAYSEIFHRVSLDVSLAPIKIHIQDRVDAIVQQKSSIQENEHQRALGTLGTRYYISLFFHSMAHNC